MVTKYKFPDDIEALFIGNDFRKWKWVLCDHSPRSNQYFFDNLDKALDVRDDKYIADFQEKKWNFQFPFHWPIFSDFERKYLTFWITITDR